MHTEHLEKWRHDHTFGQDIRKTGERRTQIVIGITLLTMIVEIAAGIAFGSMALLADGFHMASHASALTISAFAYYYTRRHAHDERFNFGTGKVNSLAGFASAVLLALIALIMAWESIGRFIHPVDIGFNQAILVAVLGLIVNGICLVILHDHGPSHEYAQGQHHHHRDHNLWSAYSCTGRCINLIAGHLRPSGRQVFRIELARSVYGNRRSRLDYSLGVGTHARFCACPARYAGAPGIPDPNPERH